MPSDKVKQKFIKKYEKHKLIKNHDQFCFCTGKTGKLGIKEQISLN